MIDVEMFKGVAKDAAINYGKKKASETLSDQEKFQGVLDKIAKNDGFKKLKKIRDECSEKDKEKIYDAGKQMGKSTVEKIIDPLGLGIIQTTKQSDPTLATIQMMRYKNNKLKALKAVCPPQTFETTMRFFVELWLFDRPKKITQEAMLEDLQSDTKSVNMKLTAFEAIASVVPYLRPLLPLIQLLKQYVKQLGETAVQRLMAKVSTGESEEVNDEEKEFQKDETLLQSKVKQSAELKDVLMNKDTISKEKSNDASDTKNPSLEQQQQARNENKWSNMKKDPAIEISQN